MGWHAIFVKSGKEEDVCNRINQTLILSNYKFEYELLVPKRKLGEKHNGNIIEVTTVMFPGYVLINTEDIQEIHTKTLRCTNLFRFLRDENGFQIIDQSEIANIICMVDKEGIVGISDVFVEDEYVKVISGPMVNYKGWVKKIDKHKRRAKVLFEFNGQEHLIDLAINLIDKLNEDEIKNEFPFHSRKLL